MEPMEPQAAGISTTATDRSAAYASVIDSIVGALSAKAPVARRTRSHGYLDLSSPPSTSGSESESDNESNSAVGAEPDAFAGATDTEAASDSNGTAAMNTDGEASLEPGPSGAAGAGMPSPAAKRRRKRRHIASTDAADLDTALDGDDQQAEDGMDLDGLELHTGSHTSAGEQREWPVVPWAPEVTAPVAATSQRAAAKRLPPPQASTVLPGAAKLVRFDHFIMRCN